MNNNTISDDTRAQMRRDAYTVFAAIRAANFTYPIEFELNGQPCRIGTPEQRAEIIAMYHEVGAQWQDLTLSDVINSAGQVQLTDPQIDAFVSLFGARCRQRTKDALRRMIRYPSTLANYGIYSRVSFTESGCHYCAGQSYPDEIRAVRELILNR